jgi:hypothetical protein
MLIQKKVHQPPLYYVIVWRTGQQARIFVEVTMIYTYMVITSRYRGATFYCRITFPLWDKVHPRGTTSPLGVKICPWGEVKNGPLDVVWYSKLFFRHLLGSVTLFVSASLSQFFIFFFHSILRKDSAPAEKVFLRQKVFSSLLENFVKHHQPKAVKVWARTFLKSNCQTFLNYVS